jgi:hypothetical protein
VTLTFVLQISISIGFLLSPSGMIEQKFDTINELATKVKHIQIKETDLQIKSSRKQASRF